jgi:hypothetical protein
MYWNIIPFLKNSRICEAIILIASYSITSTSPNDDSTVGAEVVASTED